jgi:hypothetical protein
MYYFSSTPKRFNKEKKTDLPDLSAHAGMQSHDVIPPLTSSNFYSAISICIAPRAPRPSTTTPSPPFASPRPHAFCLLHPQHEPHNLICPPLPFFHKALPIAAAPISSLLPPLHRRDSDRRSPPTLLHSPVSL